MVLRVAHDASGAVALHGERLHFHGLRRDENELAAHVLPGVIGGLGAAADID